MRRAYRRMWRVVPCGSRKSLRTDSWKDIEEILQSKLATISEEPENFEECQGSSYSPPVRLKRLAKQAKKKSSKENINKNKNNKDNNKQVGNFLLPRFSIKDSYALFMTRFSAKGGFGGLLQY